nr:hypothetical protein HK105_001198 [Polyrhizophydium stewartii]
MSSRETTAVLDGDFSPLERIVLTANGNVQRILSSYFNAKVTVDIVRNVLVESSDHPVLLKFDREVNLVCMGKTCCNAKSTIQITKPEYVKLIVVDKVGIGQLFRFLNILPEFQLLKVARKTHTLFREYSLETDGIRCIIAEEFPNNLFHEQFSAAPADQAAPSLDAVNSISPHAI